MAALHGAASEPAVVAPRPDDQRVPEEHQDCDTGNPHSTQCQVCNAAASKYRCPACNMRSCSLECVRAHKAAASCTGVRDRLAFVPLSQFSDATLLSDYRWLEEVSRADDNARRHRPPVARRELPPPLAALVHAARLRGVRLLIMPPGMQRRQCNSTRCDFRTRKLWWRVEWRFLPPRTAAAASSSLAASGAAGVCEGALQAVNPAKQQQQLLLLQQEQSQEQQMRQQQQQQEHEPEQQQQQNVMLQQQPPPPPCWTAIDGRVDEDTPLAQLLAHHLRYSPGGGLQAVSLAAHSSAGADTLTLLLRKEPCPAHAVRYYELDSHCSLRSQLAGKTVIEYPNILVALPGEAAAWDVVSLAEQEAARTEAAARRAAAAVSSVGAGRGRGRGGGSSGRSGGRDWGGGGRDTAVGVGRGGRGGGRDDGGRGRDGIIGRGRGGRGGRDGASHDGRGGGRRGGGRGGRGLPDVLPPTQPDSLMLAAETLPPPPPVGGNVLPPQLPPPPPRPPPGSPTSEQQQQQQQQQCQPPWPQPPPGSPPPLSKPHSSSQPGAKRQCVVPQVTCPPGQSTTAAAEQQQLAQRHYFYYDPAALNVTDDDDDGDADVLAGLADDADEEAGCLEWDSGGCNGGGSNSTMLQLLGHYGDGDEDEQAGS